MKSGNQYLKISFSWFEEQSKDQEIKTWRSAFLDLKIRNYNWKTGRSGSGRDQEIKPPYSGQILRIKGEELGIQNEETCLRETLKHGQLSKNLLVYEKFQLQQDFSFKKVWMSSALLKISRISSKLLYIPIEAVTLRLALVFKAPSIGINVWFLVIFILLWALTHSWHRWSSHSSHLAEAEKMKKM